MSEDIDVGQILETLNNKADRDLENTDLAGLENENGSLTWNGKDVATTDNVVSKTGDTMTGPLELVKGVGAKDALYIKNEEITFQFFPTENKFSEIKFNDKNGEYLCSLKYSHLSSGEVKFHLLLRNPYNKDEYMPVGVGYLADGTPYTLGVQPPISSNHTSMLTTTAWTRTICVGNPNFSAATSRTVGTEYTAATNGWLRVSSKVADHVTGSLYINGSHTAFEVVSQEYFDGTIATLIPIVKGQKYKGQNLSSMWWYPSI